MPTAATHITILQCLALDPDVKSLLPEGLAVEHFSRFAERSGTRLAARYAAPDEICLRADDFFDDVGDVTALSLVRHPREVLNEPSQ